MGKLAQVSGLDKSLISRLERGATVSTNSATVAALAKALGTTTDDLIGELGTSVPGTGPVTSDSIQALTDQMRTLNEDLHRALQQMQEVVMVPYLGTVPAGTPLPPVEAATTMAQLPGSLVSGIRVPAVITASGASMAPTINDGTLVIIEADPDQRFVDGAVYAVQFDGNVCIKRVFQSDGQMILQSDNPAFKPVTVREGQVLLIGRAVKWSLSGDIK